MANALRPPPKAVLAGRRDDNYRSLDGYEVRRETETVLNNGVTVRGEWVLRAPDGKLVDHDHFRTDLEYRNNIELRPPFYISSRFG